MMLHQKVGHLYLFLTITLLSSPDQTFAQCSPPPRNIQLVAVDAGSRRDTVFFGHDPAATRGIDTLLCEREIPPIPPSGVFDLRFSNPPGYDGVQPPTGLGQGTVRDYRAQTGPLQIDTFRVRFQPGSGGYPITFSWSATAVGAICDSALLVDELGGSQFSARMHETSSLVINNASYSSLLLIKFGALEIPAAPALVSPINGATGLGTGLTLVWGGVFQAVRYTIQLSTDSLFVSLLLNDSTVTTPSRSVSGLISPTTYFWRVRASNGAGTGAWSAARRFTVGGSVTNPYSVQDGWNLVSLPLSVSDPRTTVVYPAATSQAFAFGSSGYISTDTLIEGSGYWLKFGAIGDVSITGAVRQADTLQVNQGWNLIGTISTPVDTASVQEVPSGLVVTPYYGFSGSYAPADTLEAGKAYWVKADSPGVLVISSGAVSRRRDPGK